MSDELLWHHTLAALLVEISATDEWPNSHFQVDLNDAWATVTYYPNRRDTLKWSIWRNTGLLYVLGPDGAVDDDLGPIEVTAAADQANRLRSAA